MHTYNSLAVPDLGSELLHTRRETPLHRWRHPSKITQITSLSLTTLSGVHRSHIYLTRSRIHTHACTCALSLEPITG